MQQGKQSKGIALLDQHDMLLKAKQHGEEVVPNSPRQSHCRAGQKGNLKVDSHTLLCV